MFHCILSACLVSAMSSSSTTLPIQTKPDDRATKLRKLDARRRRLPHVTASALSAVYEDIAEHGLPDLTSRNNIAQASTDIVLTDTPYGPLMTAIELVPSEPGEDTIMTVSKRSSAMTVIFIFTTVALLPHLIGHQSLIPIWLSFS